MLAQRYLERQLQKQPEGFTVPDPDPARLRQLAETKRLLFLHDELLLTAYQLRRVYPMANQSEQLRQEVLSQAAALAADEPDSLFSPLRERPSQKSGYALLAAEDAAGIEIGRAAQAIIQQIQDASGRSLLMIDPKRKTLIAILDLYRTAVPNGATVCAQLRGLGYQLSMVGEGEPELLPEVGAVSIAPRRAEAQTAIVKLEKGVLAVQMQPSGPAIIQVATLADLPAALQQVRRIIGKTRRRFFWCKI